eukprot:TRINITY_DN929_c0_g1_i1.p1 TRINITY_DN929_c0_g1~~TRINITY_DN929_c0_g1_i1.p1  ORF type:complete len:455 (+),score=127.39 TRINITY_DN929_c0_g1_i1:33-1367(+)
MSQRSEELMEYLAQTTPYHVIEHTKKLLNDNNFEQLFLDQPFNTLKPETCYYICTGFKSMVAFKTPKEFNDLKFVVSTGHTDSPCLKLKPNGIISKNGYAMLNCCVYGGLRVETIFDRDLTISGAVTIVKDNEMHLIPVTLDTTVRTPLIAPHLVSKLEINKENHINPILCLGDQGESEAYFSLLMLKAILTQGVESTEFEIVDTDLFVVEKAEPSISCGSFVSSPRIDNLASCFASIQALIKASVCNNTIQLVALFDHEEVGSTSNEGANSVLLLNMMNRIIKAVPENIPDTSFPEFSPIDPHCVFAKSILLSVDGAHAVNPNWLQTVEPQHLIKPGNGVVIKYNQNNRYTTNLITNSILKKVNDMQKEIQIQPFVVRNDSPCGSTIGPSMSSSTGIRCIDLGIPMLSMHSSREMALLGDIFDLQKFIYNFFLNFENVPKLIP